MRLYQFEKSIAQLSVSNKKHKNGLVVNRSNIALSCLNNQLNTTHKVNALDRKDHRINEKLINKI